MDVVAVLSRLGIFSVADMPFPYHGHGGLAYNLNKGKLLLVKTILEEVFFPSDFHSQKKKKKTEKTEESPSSS